MEESPKRQWLDLADTIGQAALDILAGAPVTITEKRFADPKVIAIMLMSRSLSNFKAALMLIEHNLVVEARVMVRCCFENVFWIAGLDAEGDRFVTKMLHDDLRSRKSLGELALSRKPNLNEDVERKLRQKLKEINRKWPHAKSLNPKEVAFSGLLKDGYLIYSQLSADAAHPTVTSLKRYVGVSEKDGEALIEVAPAPTNDEVATTLNWACNAMLGVCVGVNQILGGTPAGQSLDQMALRYQELT